MKKIKRFTEKALKFDFYKSKNYDELFDNVPSEFDELLEEGYFDDNGDFPAGNCILIPISHLSKKINLSKYEIVEIETIDYKINKYNELIEPKNCNYTGYTSRGCYYKEINSAK